MLVLGGALALVVGIAIGALLFTIADMRRASQTARRSAQVIAAANEAEKLLLDLETGARGYALTREDQFLAPWRSARAALPRQTQRLSVLVADNPAQETLAQQLATGMRAYLDEYSGPLIDAVRRQRNPPPAAEGKRRIDALRAQFGRFDAQEQRLAPRGGRPAHARGIASDHAAARAVTVGVVVLVLGVALLVAFAVYLGRAVATPVRRVAEAADRLAAGDLGARVAVSGRDDLARLAGSFNAMGDGLQESRD